MRKKAKSLPLVFKEPTIYRNRKHKTLIVE